jgi:hypothetical protein
LKALKSDIASTPIARERRDRLQRLKCAIIDAIYQFNQVILVGFSHGALIMYSALAEIEADPRIPFQYLQKLRFYPVGAPALLPGNVLSYVGHTNPQAYEAYPYLQIHYLLDPFYNKKAGGLETTILGIARTFVLDDIVSYFKQYETKLQPQNGLYYYDAQKNIIMEYPLPKTNNPNIIDNIIGTIASYADENNIPYLVRDRYRYVAPFMRLTKETREHAIPTMLYPALYVRQLEWDMRNANMAGGGNATVFVLGRQRKVIKKGRWEYVRYKNELITLKQAKSLEKKSK